MKKIETKLVNEVFDNVGRYNDLRKEGRRIVYKGRRSTREEWEKILKRFEEEGIEGWEIWECKVNGWLYGRGDFGIVKYC